MIGTLIGGFEVSHGRKLEDISTDEKQRERLLELLRKMLVWDPSARATPAELLKCEMFTKDRAG